MKVLFAVWELAPFIKVGGLSDVARSLPRALTKLNVDIRVIIPYYKSLALAEQKSEFVQKISILYDGKPIRIDIYQTNVPDTQMPVYLLKNQRFFDIPVKDTFPVYDLAVAIISSSGISGWIPEILHCNDSHCGFIPYLIKQNKIPVKTVFMIHNLHYQSTESIGIPKKMGVDPKNCRIINWESTRRKINFMLEGIIHADIVTTVSPGYAREILTEEFGAGLDDILREESHKIVGILNGIDYDIRNPATDPDLPYKYDAEVHPQKTNNNLYEYREGKRLNKLFLQKKLNFNVDETIPMISFIGRFEAYQKGIDLIHKMIIRINHDRYQFVIMGKGNIRWEERYQWLHKFFPNSIFVQNEFDEALASQIYAASDFLLIPSRFEPCGLIQLIAMRYGCLPIAHAIGGLKDTISNFDTGFLFHKSTSHELEHTLLEAILYQKDHREKFDSMIYRAMRKDFSWNVSARKYFEIYRKLLTERYTNAQNEVSNTQASSGFH
jgi:starch synthase